VVEGIVPMNHENKSMAGAASFIPSPRIRDFLDFAEHEMLQKIVPDDVFKKVVNIKAGNELKANEKEMEMAPSSSSSPQEGSEIEGLYGNIVESMRKHHTVEEVDAILATVDKERKEVTEFLEKEGGDVDDAIAMVRERANEERTKIMNEIMENQESTTDKGK
jgi:gas vesicle protein